MHKRAVLAGLMISSLAIAFFLQKALMKPTDLKAKPVTAKPALIFKGSIPYWDQENASNDFVRNKALLNQIALFWYYIDPNGKITKYANASDDQSIITQAHQSHTKVIFTLTNLGERPGDDWDSHRVALVIQDQAHRTKHINAIISLLGQSQFDGVGIDYETVDASQRHNFTLFIQQLAAALHQSGKVLQVSLHPISDSQSASRYYFQDTQALAQAADNLTVMAYDQHESGSGPGPIASYPWIMQNLEYLKSKDIPLQKILLGVGLYGYDWTEGSSDPARDLTYPDVEKLEAKYHPEVIWDEAAQAHHFSYTTKGPVHQVWFEDSRSVAVKLQLAQANGLGGVSLWRLGEEDPAVWSQIKQFK